VCQSLPAMWNRAPNPNLSLWSTPIHGQQIAKEEKDRRGSRPCRRPRPALAHAATSSPSMLWRHVAHRKIVLRRRRSADRVLNERTCPCPHLRVLDGTVMLRFSYTPSSLGHCRGSSKRSRFALTPFCSRCFGILQMTNSMIECA